MKIAIEPFLFDNTLMNCCVFALTAVWIGIRIRILPTVAVSFAGAVYALLSLFLFPILREWYLKLPCFLLLTLPLFRRGGSYLRMLPFLLLSAATVGGAVMMLTLLFGGSISLDGTIIGTVPIRAALVSAVIAAVLPRLMRELLSVRKKKALYTNIVVVLKDHTYRLRALIDSGNLLREPVSGLPVLLIDCETDQSTIAIPYGTASDTGILLGERARSLILPDYRNATIDCICAQSPHRIIGAQAILPESVLPNQWRTEDDRMAAAYLEPPARAAARWQTRYLLVHSHKRRASGAVRPGRGSTMHRGGAD